MRETDNAGSKTVNSNVLIKTVANESKMVSCSLKGLSQKMFYLYRCIPYTLAFLIAFTELWQPNVAVGACFTRVFIPHNTLALNTVRVFIPHKTLALNTVHIFIPHKTLALNTVHVYIPHNTLALYTVRVFIPHNTMALNTVHKRTIVNYLTA